MTVAVLNLHVLKITLILTDLTQESTILVFTRTLILHILFSILHRLPLPYKGLRWFLSTCFISVALGPHQSSWPLQLLLLELRNMGPEWVSFVLQWSGAIWEAILPCWNAGIRFRLLVLFLSLHPIRHSCSCTWEVVNNGPSAWVPASSWGDLDSFRLSAAAIWRVPADGNLSCFCLFWPLCLSNKVLNPPLVKKNTYIFIAVIKLKELKGMVHFLESSGLTV